MQYKIIEKNETKVVGLEFRTTNQNGQAARDIPGFWQEFFRSDIGKDIPHKVTPGSIVGLYTDYESDASGAYTFIIGYEVSSFENIPEGTASKIIPATRYAAFKVPYSTPEDVGNAWGFIWNSGLDRTYSGDFEVYDENFINRKSTNIDILIAIR